MHFYWQLLIILFAVDRAKKKKNAITALSVSRKEKYIPGAAILARQRGAVIAFIPDLVDIFFSNMAECVTRLILLRKTK